MSESESDFTSAQEAAQALVELFPEKTVEITKDLVEKVRGLVAVISAEVESLSTHDRIDIALKLDGIYMRAHPVLNAMQGGPRLNQVIGRLYGASETQPS